MTLTEYFLPREPLMVTSEHDVDTSTSHVRGHRDTPQPTGLGDNHGLP